jgi:hypothetical protein
MDKSLLRLKESFGKEMILENLNPVDKYYFDKGIERESMHESLSHLKMLENTTPDELVQCASNICPDADIPLVGGNNIQFTNELAKMMEYCSEIDPHGTILDNGTVFVEEGSKSHEILHDTVLALSEKYPAEDFDGEIKLEESQSLDDIIWKNMDDSDVSLAYSMATKRPSPSPEEARKFIKNSILNDKNGIVARVLKSSFLKNYSFKEALEEVPFENIKASQEKGISLFESNGILTKVERSGKSYRITKFK